MRAGALLIVAIFGFSSVGPTPGSARGQSAIPPFEPNPPLDEPTFDAPPDQVPPPAGAAPLREPGYLGLIADDRRDNGRGVRIVEIIAGGPAEQAGLEVDDLVVNINDRAIRDMTDVARVIEGSSAGDKLNFKIERGQEAQIKQITLGTRPAREGRRFDEFGQIPEAPAAPADGAAAGRRPWLGVRAKPLTPELRQSLRVPVEGGALVTEIIPDSPASRAGLTVDAVIVGFDNQPVNSSDALGQLVSTAQVGAPIAVSYYRGGQLRSAEVTLIEIQRPAAGAGAGEPGAPALGTGELPPVGSGDRVEQLEQRIRELEERLERIEQLLRSPSVPPAEPPQLPN